LVVESYIAKQAPEGMPVSTDPIFYYWKPGVVDIKRFESRTPFETAPQIAFPLDADGKDLHLIGGFRLLCKPVWAPKSSKLAFAAYNTNNRKASFYLLDFSGDIIKSSVDAVPENEKKYIDSLIDKDVCGYLFESISGKPIEAKWVSDSRITFTFDGARSHEWEIN
jgi:hypothetical protein